MKLLSHGLFYLKMGAHVWIWGWLITIAKRGKIMKYGFKFLIAMAIVGLMGGCSSTATDTDTSEISADAAAAVGAVFSSSGDGSVNQVALKGLLEAFIRRARASETCLYLDEGPSNVTISGQGDSGTYGATGDTVTLDTDTDFCEDSNGADVTGDTLFAAFTLTSADITCDGETTTVTMSGSGVFTEDDDGFQPHIYGEFTMTMGDDSATVNCTIGLEEGSDGAVSEASCTDSSSGETVEMDSDASCTIDAGDET